MKHDGSPAPRHRLADLREWLLDRIDGGEETRGEDGLISGFIRQIDALDDQVRSLTRPKTITEWVAAQAQTEPRGCPTPGACSAVAELADLKQRLLPQFAGRAQMAEHERDALLEQLIAARSATEETAIGHARYEYLRTLNPRKFAALYNEALMGVHQFDDLVDRYRDASQPSPTTKEQPK